MTKPKIFIDGEHGTTGLQIRARLEPRSDLDFIRLGEAERKDKGARAEALNAADIAILCLPDEAAREAVSLVKNPRTRIIDSSSAHRTARGWVYGFPEMAEEQSELIARAPRVTNPGCYATGAIALLRPLVRNRLIPMDYPVTISAVSGYTGGGKALIAAFEDPSSKDYTRANFRLYAMGIVQKHIDEIQMHSLMDSRPLFVPSVARYAQGMLVQIPLQLWTLKNKPTLTVLHAALAEHYKGSEFVEVAPLEETRAIGVASSLDPRNLEPEALNGTNKMRLHVFGNEKHEQAVLVALL
ncbi:MAG TPA: N-acetyl-gamma-glutamyl-phosphate reductase, partial [Alphaproteobacteria bacterium]|nr:N-acetyl-gamma-glutamyl-phosphate reductase [Alphaproteobacteria bacterium]